MGLCHRISSVLVQAVRSNPLSILVWIPKVSLVWYVNRNPIDKSTYIGLEKQFSTYFVIEADKFKVTGMELGI